MKPLRPRSTLGEDLEAWGGSWHVVVLTPAAQAEPLGDPQPVLWFPAD